MSELSRGACFDCDHDHAEFVSHAYGKNAVEVFSLDSIRNAVNLNTEGRSELCCIAQKHLGIKTKSEQVQDECTSV